MSIRLPSVGTTFPDQSASRSDSSSLDEAPCLHCGTLCPSPGPAAANQPAFCCPGCETVYHLLHQNGLSNYYHLADDARIPIPQSDPNPSLSFLDDAKTRESLLDFSNGHTAKIRFHIPAIHCNACVWLLEQLYQLEPRIGESRVNFLKKELAVTFDEQALKLSELVQQLHTLGYPPHLQLAQLNSPPRSKTSIGRWHLQVGIAGFCFGNIMLLSFPHYLGLNSEPNDEFNLLIRFLPMILALPVLLFSASGYWQQAYRSLRSG